MSSDSHVLQRGHLKLLRRVLITLAVLIPLSLIMQLGEELLSAIETIDSVSGTQSVFPFLSKLGFIIGSFIRHLPEFGVAALCAFAGYTLSPHHIDVEGR